MDKRQSAINSIPAYIQQCRFFVILCPNMRHSQNEVLLNKRTWRERGWCRLERLCRELSENELKHPTMEVFSATHQAVSATMQLLNSSVGEGKFSKAGDLDKLGPVLSQLVERRLRLHLESNEFHEYRLLLNLGSVLFRKMPSPQRYVYIPGFQSELRFDHPDYVLGNFLYQNGFQNIHQRLNGWTPICFAALYGDTKLLQTLLDANADVNDCITKTCPRFGFGKDMNVLALTAYVRHNDALKFLISAGANIHAVDEYVARPIHWCSVGGNPECVEILLAAGSTKTDPNILGYSPFVLACSAGEIECMKVLMPDASMTELNEGLHAAILQSGGSAEVVSELIKAHADVNHQLITSPLTVFGALLMGLGLRHRWKESTLSTYAYHHYQATPLMCSVLTGAYEVTALLLAAGARTDLWNYRQKTALDIAYEVSAPDFVISALKGESDCGERLLKDYITIARSNIYSESL